MPPRRRGRSRSSRPARRLRSPGRQRAGPAPKVEDVSAALGAGPGHGIAAGSGAPSGRSDRRPHRALDRLRPYRAILDGEPYPVRALVSFGANALLANGDTLQGYGRSSARFFAQIELVETPTSRVRGRPAAAGELDGVLGRSRSATAIRSRPWPHPAPRGRGGSSGRR